MDTLAWAEGHATALAAAYLTAADLAAARGHNEQMRAALERLDPLIASEHNQAFHAVLRRRCPNEYLNEIVSHAVDRVAAMLRTVFVFVPTRAQTAVADHERLLELIESAASEDEIERYAREHKLRTLAAYLLQEAGAEDESPAPSNQELVRRALSRA
jgi:DNA-binding GntR family transcriptional regulator